MSSGEEHPDPSTAWPAVAAFLRACHLLGAKKDAFCCAGVVGVASKAKTLLGHEHPLDSAASIGSAPLTYTNHY